MTCEGKCQCGRKLCDLCHKVRAEVVMKNRVNGNELRVCRRCHKEVWGDKK